MGQVINIQKQKNMGQIAAIAKHNLRLYQPINTDPKKTCENVFLIGSKHINVLKEIDDRLENISYRKDANKLVNLVFSASNEEMSKIDVLAWSKEITDFCVKKFGKDNILYSVLHKDEKTDHLHISFTPIVENKLRSNLWFDGPSKISSFRKEVYKINKKYGFKQDDIEKKAKSEDIQDYYNDVNNLKKLDLLVEKDLEEINKISMFSLNTKKVINEKIPNILNIVKLVKAYRNSNKKISKDLLITKKQNQQLKEENLKFNEMREFQQLSYIQIEELKKIAKEMIEKKEPIENVKIENLNINKNNVFRRKNKI